MEGVICVYIDDILIYSKDRAKHRSVTRRVLEQLREQNLLLRKEKCEFEQTCIEYLGLIISEGKVEMDPVKVRGVTEWPMPKSQKEVQSFLGFANFYRRFIKDFSSHARPLFDLIKKEVQCKWGEDEEGALRKLKDHITSAPVLTFPDDAWMYQVEADASDFATGATLSQQSPEDDTWHPIAFFSKSLSPVERNYEIHDKEMLAIMQALEEWRHFLEGTRLKFEIWTDHKNLEYFRTSKKLNQKQARWSLYLSRFDFTLHHRPGRSMGKADALSRRSDHGLGAGDNENMHHRWRELFAIRALEGVTAVGEERESLRPKLENPRASGREVPVAKAVAELRKG